MCRTSDAASALLGLGASATLVASDANASVSSGQEISLLASANSSNEDSPTASSSLVPSLPSGSSSSGTPDPFASSFINTLIHLLDDKAHSQVITWMPDGTAFTIVNSKQFVKDEMPKLFKIRNMSSFIRKLTRFGFSRKFDKETMNSDIFAHQDFIRDEPERASRIKCAPPAKSSAVPVAATLRTKASTVSPAPKTVAEATQPGRMPAPTSLSSGHTPPPAARLRECARRVSLESDLSPPSAMIPSPSEALRSNLYGGFLGPSSTSRVSCVPNSELALGAAIENLLRQRESLRQGADANTMALVRLLGEQQRVRRQDTASGSVNVTSPPITQLPMTQRHSSGKFPAYFLPVELQARALPQHNPRYLAYPHNFPLH
ncbi:HSF-type DNA-binding protein [Nitzschia inconspicua]|uniref:HSF-type DNA-binding protein n=1 Tax=Nitzschia inconspicua TaxID=303405 RepID=A0A9K3K5X6_9STRA|nr:HSF-type DNA-binding protein [Nitzschia inconspicua]KAG7358682.1 HSF-type DNA-binding protein [Nitzschia inconspicua]